MDSLLSILQDFQPAAIAVGLVALLAIFAGKLAPPVGPWAAMLTLAAVTVYVGNRVTHVDPRPEWLYPLALAGGACALSAGYRLYKAIQATRNGDHTIGYVFPAAMGIIGMWVSIALIKYDGGTTATLIDSVTK